MKGFQILLNYMKKQDLLKKIKIAVVCDDPKTIVFPTLGSKIAEELRIKPFSTMDAAVSWALE